MYSHFQHESKANVDFYGGLRVLSYPGEDETMIYLIEPNTGCRCFSYPGLTGASSCTACPVGSYFGFTGT